jgi:hypothetical protein
MTTFEKIRHASSLADGQKIKFPESDYDEIIKFCFKTSRRLSENDLAFLQERIQRYVVDGFISSENYKFFITYLDSLRIMIYHLRDFYQAENVDQYLLRDLHFSSVDANDLLTKKGLPLHHFCLRFSQSQIGNLAVTYVNEKNGENVVSDVLIKFVNLGNGGVGWEIQEEGKELPEIYPTIEELIMKCKVFNFFCFENNDLPKESVLRLV